MPENFASYFERATGRRPYDYQRALGEASNPPAVLDVPTGSGKTHALLVAWMHQRLLRRTAPRRLVYALPMRTLVEQTAAVARKLRSRLGLAEDELPIHVLMGARAQSSKGDHDPRHNVPGLRATLAEEPRAPPLSRLRAGASWAERPTPLSN